MWGWDSGSLGSALEILQNALYITITMPQNDETVCTTVDMAEFSFMIYVDVFLQIPFAKPYVP